MDVTLSLNVFLRSLPQINQKYINIAYIAHLKYIMTVLFANNSEKQKCLV